MNVGNVYNPRVEKEVIDCMDIKDQFEAFLTEERTMFASVVEMTDKIMLISAYRGVKLDITSDEVVDKTGLVYVYERIGESWLFDTVLYGTGLVAGAMFGRSLAIYDKTIVVGAPGQIVSNASNCEDLVRGGAVYVFEREDGVWIEKKCLKSDKVQQDSQYGYSVDLYGDSIVVSAMLESLSELPFNSIGVVYVYKKRYSSWERVACLCPSEKGMRSYYGYSVVIHENTIVVGAYGKGAEDRSDGAAYIYEHNGIDWNLQDILVPRNANTVKYGFSLAINKDTIVIGAPGEAVEVVNEGIEGMCKSGGAVYIYHKKKGYWNLVSRVKVENVEENDLFGYSVSMLGRFVCIGVPWKKGKKMDVIGFFRKIKSNGAVYIFGWNGTCYVQRQYIISPNMNSEGWFGFVLANNKEELMVGSPNDFNGKKNGGTSYLYALKNKCC